MRANHYVYGQTGWQDLFVDALTLRPGLDAPLWNATYEVYEYNIGSAARGKWHIDHRYKPGTDVHMHVHVIPLTTSTGNIVFGFEWRYARGYSVDVFSAPTTTLVVPQAGAGAIETHQIIESAAITIPNLETDGVIKFRVFRDASDTFVGGVGLELVDLHFQSDRNATTQRNRGAGWDPA